MKKSRGSRPLHFFKMAWQPKTTAAVLFLVALYLWPAIVFYPMGRFLLRDDRPGVGADFVVLLMGEASLRPAAAAKAVLAGISNHLLFVSAQSNALVDAGLVPSEDDLTIAMLKRTGLDDGQFTMISDSGRATSTVDEALAVRAYLHTKSVTPKRLVIVTSWPHSARAGWIIEKILGNNGMTLELLPVDKVPFDLTNWWQSESGLLFVFEEYIKWGRYLVKYWGRDVD
jgi:uncharacterized SAM-binding protein YcdF (DUF218 family)